MSALKPYHRINAYRKKPLASALAGLCLTCTQPVTAAVLPEMFDAPPYSARIATAPPPPPSRSPNVLPVTNCNDDGEGSLRVAAEIAADGETVDLTQLASLA